tara:strand:+ start:925 stop:1599 length:675 start_codon:yes stop_codon:yes gene_type:complete
MHQQKSKKILLYLFLFLIIGTLNNKNLNNINFGKLNKISVYGMDEENNYKLAESLNVLKFESLFFMNKNTLKGIIGSNNLVENFSVFKNYPSSLNIYIVKTKFLARIKKNNNNFYLGSNGKLIKVNDVKKDIPFVFGNFEIQDFFNLKKAIDKTSFQYDDIKNLFFFQSGRWDIETTSGVLIKLPRSNIEKALKLSIKVIDDGFQKDISKIDLRQKNQIILNGK